MYRVLEEQSGWALSRLHGRIANAMATAYSPSELEENALAYARHLIIGRQYVEAFAFQYIVCEAAHDGVVVDD